MYCHENRSWIYCAARENGMRETASFTGTRIQEIVEGLDSVYGNIVAAQARWREASPFHCPDGCGSCCVDFEPDVLESEALYLAAWMLYHQKERAEAILNGTFVSPRNDRGSGCFLFNPDSPYHCTVYDGRCLICRLFGYTGDRGKDGRPRWKPCKFLPVGSGDAAGDLRRQYGEQELLDRFGVFPPLMSDITAQVLALTPDNIGERRSLREALPAAIGKIRMLQRFTLLPTDPDAPEPNPESPMPRAS